MKWMRECYMYRSLSLSFFVYAWRSFQSEFLWIVGLELNGKKNKKRL